MRGIDVNYCSFGRVESVDRYVVYSKKKKKDFERIFMMGISEYCDLSEIFIIHTSVFQRVYRENSNFLS